MIKLIAADMDGTLLDSAKKLPENFGALIDALEERGVLFVAASGRPMHSLRTTFAPWEQRMGFLSDNGALLVSRGKFIKRNMLSHDQALELLEAMSAVEGFVPCIEGEFTAFYDSDYPGFPEKIGKYFARIEKVENIFEAIDREEISKISGIDYIDPETNGDVKLAAMKEKYELGPSGDGWIIAMAKGSEKGKGFLEMIDILGIRPEETMAFGDYLNDKGMLEVCPNSFCMKNGDERVKAAAARVTDYTNDENGVVRQIAKELGLNI